LKKSATPNPQRVKLAAARIRQFACLDITGPQLAPLLLRELRDVLAFDTGGYFHPGADQRLESYMEAADVQAMVPLYLDPRMQQDERRVARTYEQAAQQEFGPQTKEQLIKVPWAEFVRSDFYNVLLHPIGLDDCVSLMPRLAGGRPVGSLKLYRRRSAVDFRPAELRELGRLERFLAQALEPKSAPAHDETEAQGSEMLVTTAEGRLLWMSARAERLLAQAFGSHRRPGPSQLPDRLKLLLQQLRWIRSGRETDALPKIEVRNALGLFTIRACLLQPATAVASAAAAGDAVGIQITKHVSRSVRLLEALRRSPLPPRQAEIGYWIARGSTEADIAARLNLSPHTVVYHRRQLHASMGTANRSELVARLLAMPLPAS
jgi:DNA-binding CsgD family transcriptional regulator